LQIKPLQDSHTAHWPPAVHTVAAVPAKTAHKPPIKISALIAGFIVAHILKEAKRSPSQDRKPDRYWLSLTAEIRRLFGLVTKSCRFLPRSGKPLEDCFGEPLAFGLQRLFGPLFQFRANLLAALQRCLETVVVEKASCSVPRGTMVQQRGRAKQRRLVADFFDKILPLCPRTE